MTWGKQIRTVLSKEDAEQFDRIATELGLSRYELAQRCILEKIYKDKLEELKRNPKQIINLQKERRQEQHFQTSQKRSEKQPGTSTSFTEHNKPSREEEATQKKPTKKSEPNILKQLLRWQPSEKSGRSG